MLTFLITPSGMNINQIKQYKSSLQQFEEEVEYLKEKLQMPGITALIIKDDSIIWQKASGYADLENKTPLNISHIFPLASVTKTFAAVLTMQMAEEGKINLDSSVNFYLPKLKLPHSIKVRHVLSHTSQTIPGENFEYTHRYSWLGDILEKISGKDLDKLMKERILDSLKMSRTIPGLGAKAYEHLTDSIAKPYYFFKGKVSKGIYPSNGLKTSSGLASTVGDLAKYAISLDKNKLLTQESRQKMFEPFLSNQGKKLAYALGWFSTRVLDYDVVWHYGQLECYSTLLLKVPEKKLTLIALSNSGALSDHGRMINGNPLTSSLILAFFKHMVLSDEQPSYFPRLDYENQPDLAEAFIAIIRNQENRTFYREELISKIILQAYLGQEDEKSLKSAIRLTEILFRLFPETEKMALPQFSWSLLAFLQKEKIAFLEQTEKIILNCSNEFPTHPEMIYLAGRFYQLTDNKEKATFYFSKIAELPNQSVAWFKVLALTDAGEYLQEKNPEKAKKYLKQVITWGWNFDGAYFKAQNLLKKLNTK